MSESEDDGTHECPKNGCEIRLPRGMLACRQHWREVPYGLRTEVLLAWRDIGDAPEGARDYLVIRQRCIDAINGVNSRWS